MIKTEFEFGEKITVTGSIRRAKNGYKRLWYHYDESPKEAIYLNGVLLANGKVAYENYGGDGGDYYFETEGELIKGAWICEYNRKPRKVFLSDCHKKES